MGIRVGMPILKLGRDVKSTKRKGNASGIAMEALSERHSADPDIDRSKSYLNEYTGFQKGRDLVQYWYKEADAHVDALGRKLKSNAVIGYQVLIKPDYDSMKSMSKQEQINFLHDSIDVTIALLQEHGLQVDATALHFDEVNPHPHVLGHDSEYKAGKKIGLKLYNAFNSEFPRRMRELGYDVEDISVYDAEKVATMTDQEKQEYKQKLLKQKKSKKKSGRSSTEYKEDKIKEKQLQLQQQEQRLKQQEQRLKQQEQELQQRIQEYDSTHIPYKKRYEDALDFMHKYKVNEVYLDDIYTREVENRVQYQDTVSQPPMKLSKDELIRSYLHAQRKGYSDNMKTFKKQFKAWYPDDSFEKSLQDYKKQQEQKRQGTGIIFKDIKTNEEQFSM